MEHLFGHYEALVNPLEGIGVAKNRRVARTAAKPDLALSYSPDSRYRRVRALSIVDLPVQSID